MLELLFLLLPVAAAYGWYMAAEVRNKQSRMRRTVFLATMSPGLTSF